MTPELEQKIRNIIRDEFQKNYFAGVPKIPPHTHNGIDNLKINASDINGNVSGTPGEPLNSVQFNLDGAFAGSENLTFVDGDDSIPMGPKLKLDSPTYSSFGNDGETILSGGSANNTTDAGYFRIITEPSEDTAGSTVPRSIQIRPGDGNFTDGIGGAVYIESGNGFTANQIDIRTGDFGTGVGGAIQLIAGTAVSGGNNIAISSGLVDVQENLGVGSVTVFDLQGGTNMIVIRNGTAPVGAGGYANGGYLYAQAGALYWKGTSGAVTLIAPA